MKSQIYYFSGTGNSRHVSAWINQTFNDNQLESEEIDISNLERRKAELTPETEYVGFVSPTHGFNYPPIMLHFILRFPKGNGKKAFLLNTRAGLKMGKFFIPGLSGIATLLAALILMFKGYKIIGMRPVDLPSNWISLHPGVREKVADSLYENCQPKIEKFAKKLLDGKRDFRSLLDIVQDLIIAPISLFYYFFGRFFFSKTFIASHRCTKCGLCEKSCPVNAIEFIDDRPFWTYHCESCMRCMNTCPERAIENPHGVIALIIWFLSAFVLRFVYNLTNLNQHLIDLFGSGWGKTIEFFIDNIIVFGGLFVCYRILHYLLRFHFVEKIAVYTSFTKYKFWRRYKIRKVRKQTEVGK